MGKLKDKLFREMMVVLNGTIEEKRVCRSIRRITNLIYNLKGYDRRNVFERLLCIITEIFYEKQIQQGKSSITGLAFALAERGLADNDLICLDIVQSYNYKNNFSNFCKASQRMMIAFFKYFGSDLDISRRFVEVCLLDHTKRIEKLCVISGSEVDKYWQNNTSGLFGVSVMAMRCPVGEQYPQKLWLINLIEAGQRGDETCRDLLWSIVTIAGQISEHMTIMSQSGFEKLVGQKENGELEYQNMLSRPDFHFIILPDQITDWFNNFISQRNQIGQKLGQKGESFREWFIQHRDRLAKIFDRKCREIIEKPKYGLRPFGFDSIMIKVSPLYNVGVRSVSFYPEGECFPDVKVSLTVLKLGWVNCQFWAQFRDFSLQIIKGVISPIHGKQDFDYQKAVFEYILVDALHRIIVGQSKTDLDKNKIDRQKYHDVSTPKKQVVVRPFLRRLPYGHQASDMARELAETQMGWILPDEGVTFVQTHDRWQGLPEGKVAPLFEYTDQTIITSLE